MRCIYIPITKHSGRLEYRKSGLFTVLRLAGEISFEADTHLILVDQYLSSFRSLLFETARSLFLDSQSQLSPGSAEPHI